MKTIQEAFIEMYYNQDPDYGNEKKYNLACDKFRQVYNLAPPYTSFYSFRQILYLRKG